jgi:hypothetical protein
MLLLSSLIAGSAGLMTLNRLHKMHISDPENFHKTRLGNGCFEEAIQTPRKKYALVLWDNKIRASKQYGSSDSFFCEGLENNGYEKENIYLLKWDVSQNSDYNVLRLNDSNLEDVTKHLGGQITNEDTFFMYVMTHGAKSYPIPFAPCGKSEIFSFSGFKTDEDHLEESILRIKPDHAVFFFNSCYGGGFAKRFGKGRNISLSLSSEKNVVFANTFNELETGYYKSKTPFTLAFFAALKGESICGKSLELQNRNIESLFDFATSIEIDCHKAKYLGAEPDATPNYLQKNFLRNVPHLYYDKIDPSKIFL